MRQTLNRLARMVIGYGAVQWAGPFLALIFTPIITRILSPSDYGIADVALTVASAVGTLALFALPQALAAHFNDRGDEAWHRGVTGSALALACAIGVPIGIVLLLFAPQIAQAFLGNTDFSRFFQLVGATVVFAVCSGILTAAAQAGLHVRWGMLLSITSIAATVFGNIVFIIVLRLGALGMVLTPITAGIAISIVALITMRRAIGAPSRSLVGTLGRSGAALLPTVFSGWALMLIDRLFLVHYVSTADLGYYAIANKIAALAYIAMTPLYTAWTPLALSMQDHPDARQRYATMARYLIAAVLGVALALGLFAPEILIILTRPAYLPAAPYVGFLAYVHVFTGFGVVLYTSAMAGKQLKALSWTVTAGALINLVLNFLLIPVYGVWGATIATVIGYAVPQVLLYPLLQKRYPVPYPTRRLLAALLVETVLLVAGLMIPPLAFPVRAAIKVLLFAMLPAAFVLLGVLTRHEIRSASQLLLDRLSPRPNRA